MQRWLVRASVALGLLTLGGIGAIVLWPERLAVNAPLTHALFGWGISAPEASAFGDRIRVPEGFSIGLYAEVPRARFLRPTPAGDLLVSAPRSGEVVILERDRNADGLPDGKRALLAGLDRPHGLELRDGWLYVAVADAIVRVRFDVQAGQATGETQRFIEGLPEGGNHWTRTVRFGPDGGLYVSVGSSCNVCEETDPRRAALLRFEPDGSGGRIYARGLRNAVGFDWRPADGALYATDNGRDLLGDDFPPCELNRVVDGGDYGWPVANGNRVLDPDLGAGQEARASASIPPAFEFRAHNAPLGIAFVGGDALPDAYRGAALVALHGSWNRRQKDGYKVVSLHWDAEGRIEERDFVWGFLEGDDVIGRPVDVAQAADGSLFVSDDYAGAIYRIATGSVARATSPGAFRSAARDPLAELGAQEIRAESAAGEALYQRFDCASCHEPERAVSGMVPVPLSDLAARHDLASLPGFLAAPTPPMPAFPMDAGERRHVSVYLLSRFGGR